MNEQEYHRMRAVEDGSWWFVGKRFLVEALLRRAASVGPGARFLDVGCGTGAMLRVLAKLGDSVGTDMAPAALRLAAERKAALLCASDAQRLAFADDSFAAGTALDVIEHLDDPGGALREMRRVCKPGGAVVITVPAHPFLWSDHDVALAHRRRYTLRLLREQVAAAGLHVERMGYGYAAFFLPALIVRRARRLCYGRRTPTADLGLTVRPVNALLTAYMWLEARALGVANLPVGTSLLCVARKRIS